MEEVDLDKVKTVSIDEEPLIEIIREDEQRGKIEVKDMG